MIETNVDDMNPQFYDHVMDRLFAAGARDVFLAPIQMRKTAPRPCLALSPGCAIEKSSPRSFSRRLRPSAFVVIQ